MEVIIQKVQIGSGEKVWGTRYIVARDDDEAKELTGMAVMSIMNDFPCDDETPVQMSLEDAMYYSKKHYGEL